MDLQIRDLKIYDLPRTIKMQPYAAVVHLKCGEDEKNVHCIILVTSSQRPPSLS